MPYDPRLEHAEELGRWFTDEALFIAYGTGVVARQDRRTTIWDTFTMTGEQLDTARDYFGKGEKPVGQSH